MSGDRFQAAFRGGYPWAMRALHWTTAVLLVGSYTTMWAIMSAASSEEEQSLSLLHRSLGVVVLGLTIARLVLRQRSRVPALPRDIPWMQRLAARLTAFVLYTLLFLQPMLGLTASMYDGDRITFVGGLAFSSLLVPDRRLAHTLFEAHGTVATLLLGVLGLHIVAALYHHVIRGDEVLAGMLPGMRSWQGSQSDRRPAARP